MMGSMLMLRRVWSLLGKRLGCLWCMRCMLRRLACMVQANGIVGLNYGNTVRKVLGCRNSCWI
jgi:hypothetical protein